jgi:amidase
LPPLLHFSSQPETNELVRVIAWGEIAADKKARIEASIPPEWRLMSEPVGVSVIDYPEKSGILSSVELAITKSSATDLVAQLAAGKFTSVAVTTAFCKRAALAHQLVRHMLFSGLNIY